MCVLDFIGLGSDAGLAGVATIGTYYAFECMNLFKGDVIMERVLRLTTTAFAVVAFFSVLDFILTLGDNPLLQYHLVRIASVFALGAFVVAVAVLARWGKLPTESRTRP